MCIFGSLAHRCCYKPQCKRVYGWCRFCLFLWFCRCVRCGTRPYKYLSDCSRTWHYQLSGRGGLHLHSSVMLSDHVDCIPGFSGFNRRDRKSDQGAKSQKEKSSAKLEGKKKVTPFPKTRRLSGTSRIVGGDRLAGEKPQIHATKRFTEISMQLADRGRRIH